MVSRTFSFLELTQFIIKPWISFSIFLFNPFFLESVYWN